MPYRKPSDLPNTVTDHLPMRAQEIYLAAYNSAWQQYDRPSERRGGASREETAARVAWAAVKRQFRKDKSTGAWMEKTDLKRDK